jgi:hypothetical protein
MTSYQFIDGEVFSVEANDPVQALRIINAFFDGEWDGDTVTDDDINAVRYVGTKTKLLGEAEPGKMYNY